LFVCLFFVSISFPLDALSSWLLTCRVCWR
jgi:hypothetical protein